MRVTGIGDNVVDRYLSLGRMFPGGNALNVAVFARRAGAETAYIGAVGDDAAGALILEGLRAEGVDTSRVRVLPGETAYADVRLVDGDRQFVGSSKGVSSFTPDAGDMAILAGSHLVHSSIYSDLDDWVREVRADLPISFDFSNCDDRPTIEALVPGLAFAAFSAAHLTVQAATDLVAWAASLGTNTVLATRGSEGAVLWAEGRVWTCPASRAQVVDTLGAGDAFIAAFLVARLEGAAPPEALDAAASAAAETCGYYGAFDRGGEIRGHTVTLAATPEG